MRNRNDLIFKLVDDEGHIVLADTPTNIAKHYNVSKAWVYKAYHYGYKFLKKYKVELSNFQYVVQVFEDDELVFEGNRQKVAKFLMTTNNYVGTAIRNGYTVFGAYCLKEVLKNIDSEPNETKRKETK